MYGGDASALEPVNKKAARIFWLLFYISMVLSRGQVAVRQKIIGIEARNAIDQDFEVIGTFADNGDISTNIGRYTDHLPTS